MAICIPPEPDFPEHLSAERAIWEKLRDQLPDDAVLAHSVQVRHGRAEHEIDLLVLWPDVGLAAIEVKGGLITVSNGQWAQSDRGGAHRIMSPIAQAQSSSHALKEWLKEQLGTQISSRFAYMAALPYTKVPHEWTMAGIPRSLVIDQDDLVTIAARIRTAIETEGGGAGPLARTFMERIVKRLNGNLAPAAEVDGDAAALEDHQNALTAKQATLLSSTRSLPRVRFLGGAGSGKTWLAVEKARQLSSRGLRVGLFCYNKGLGLHLQREVSRWKQQKPAFTGEFHEYVRSLGIPDGVGQDYFDVQMPRMLSELAVGLDAEERFDVVIVDEAQDFAPEWWDALLACMKDPLNGQVFAFMDDRQDVYRRWNGEALGSAFGEASPMVPIHVDENLRNTRKIADTFKGLAGEHFKPRGGTGLPVRFINCSAQDAIDVASDCVDALIDEGWANNQIALLTTHRRHPIHQDFVSDGVTDPAYWREFHENQQEFYGHVLGFKGLERSVVILCVNGFKELERAKELLYVGLSRARCLLVIVGEQNVLEEVGGPDLRLALKAAEKWDPQASESAAQLSNGR